MTNDEIQADLLADSLFWFPHSGFPLPVPRGTPPATHSPMTPAQLTAVIDHTLLAPEATAAAIDAAADEAARYGFATLCVQPAWVRRCVDRVGGRVIICSVIGFPHGANRPTVKAIEATAAVKDGAGEIDMVAFLPHLLTQDISAARTEIAEVVRGARAVRPEVVVKVIVESAALVADRSEDEAQAIITAACQAVREGGADFIKTSTGFHPAGGAETKVVRRMTACAGGLQVKASGGIRTLADARAMLEAGATRLGLSRSVDVLAELER